MRYETKQHVRDKYDRVIYWDIHKQEWTLYPKQLIRMYIINKIFNETKDRRNIL